MLIFLIRHGVTPATGIRLTPAHIGLSEEGKKQAEALAERFAGVALDAIYTSTLERAIQTAKPLAAAKKIRPRTREDLGDTRYGEWEGRTLRSLAKTRQWRTILSHPSAGRFPGGEALRETSARAIAAVGAIVEAHSKQVVAVFTHADIIKMAVSHYAGIHVDNFMRIAVAPASVSAIWAGEGTPRVLTVNDTGSLATLVPARMKR